MILFIDLTVASAFPLLCGYIGEEVLWRNPHSFENSWKSLDVNWGPWSDQTMSGAPVRQKALRSAVMRRGVVVLWPMWMMSGQSVWQSTMMRKSCPAYEQKSTAISWNGLDGLGFVMSGSLGSDGRLSWHCLHVRIMLSMSLLIPGQ